MDLQPGQTVPSLGFHILASLTHSLTFTAILNRSHLLQQGVNDSSWLCRAFSVWRAEREGENNTTHMYHYAV